MEKFKKFFKLPVGWLVIALIVCLFTGIFGQMVNTAGYSVSVTKETIDMDKFYTDTYGSVEAAKKPTRLSIGDNKDGMVNAKLTGFVYRPKKVNKDNPAPCIVLTHGYLNSKEMQEAPAIEMARRGYVVFEFDQYDHGESTWDTPAAFNFYVWSVYDAVEYMYSKDYVLKAADGTGMIAVSGHSMGGFSSEIAAAWDEMNLKFGRKTYRMISAVLAVGADFRYDDGYVNAYSGGLYPKTYLTYATRSCGTIAGEYDEFFFNNKETTGANTVIKKDYPSDPVGYAMLGLTAPGKAATWYKVDPATNLHVEDDTTIEYGERIIFVPKGDHPYNTWSPEVTKYMIEFYNHAFEYQLSLHDDLGTLSSYNVKSLKGTNQIWWLKEVFTCIGIFGLVAAICFATTLLVKAPFFSKVTTSAEDIPVLEPQTKTRKGLAFGITALTILYSGYLIPAFMDRSDAEGLSIVKTITDAVLFTILILAILGGIAYLVIKATQPEEKIAKTNEVFARFATGSFVIGLVALVLKYVVTLGTKSIVGSTNPYWNAPSINTIAYWAIASGLFSLLFGLITHYTINKGATKAHLGLKANWKQVGIAFLNGVILSAFGMAIVLLSTVIFKVDFRVYTYAFSTITGNQFVSALRYMPLFFIFYLCAGIGVANATSGKKGVKADLIAIAVEALPCCLFIAYQYGTLLTTHTAAFPAFALNGILVQGLIPTLIILAIFQRRSLEKTNNIWTGVFLNTIFFTLITLANTCVYSLA